MKILILLLLGLTAATLVHSGRAQAVNTNSGSNSGYTLANHPALLALTRNAPKDAQGKVVVWPAMTSDSLSNPLANHLALVTRDGHSFTIVPKDSLLIGSHCSYAASVLRSSMPTGTYLPLSQFLKLEDPCFARVALTAAAPGHFALSAEAKLELCDAHTGKLVLLVDGISGWPIPHLQTLPGPALGLNRPAS